METATRDTCGRFQPGGSGNPASKQLGTLKRATVLKRWLAEADEEQAVRALTAQAAKGNVAALRILFDRIDPKPRGRPITFALAENSTFAERFQAVFVAMAARDITPDEALQSRALVFRPMERRSIPLPAGERAG